MKYNQDTRIISLNPKGDDRGKLIAIEENTECLPFSVKRVYYIYDTTPNVVRGKHAHRNLKQLLICTSGSCAIMCDDGTKKVEYTLNWPDKGLLIDGLIWREMKDFSKGSVLMVLASACYDESDYIRDYGVFMEELKK